MFWHSFNLQPISILPTPLPSLEARQLRLSVEATARHQALVMAFFRLESGRNGARGYPSLGLSESSSSARRRSIYGRMDLSCLYMPNLRCWTLSVLVANSLV